MESFKKREVVQIIDDLIQIDEVLFSKQNLLEKGNLLYLCQDAAILVGNYLESLDIDCSDLVKRLESYCELVYRIGNDPEAEEKEDYIKQILDQLNAVRTGIEDKFPYKRKEIVFFPYKASMWDSLESVWRAAANDPDCDAYVVPIPYYDRNPDGSFGVLHYEGDDFPQEVPIIHYNDYVFEKRKPDVIFIHNPYDEHNLVTSVEPRYYSSNLKNYTDCLAYVPYFLFPKAPAEHLINTPPLLYADCIFVQNETVKEAYIDELIKYEQTNQHLLEAIFAVGTPKTDKMYEVCRDGIPIPEEWIRMAQGKKRLFLNTNVSLILNNSEKFIDNLDRIFKVLIRRGDVFVVWREHPLTYETLKSMKPGMMEAYDELKRVFIQSGLGVLDTHSQPHEAIYFSDCYFGAGGSLIPIYAVTGKPMLVTAYKYPDNIFNREIPLPVLLRQAENHMYFSERYTNTLDLFLDNLEIMSQYKAKRHELLSQLTYHIDGTVGTRILEEIKRR